MATENEKGLDCKNCLLLSNRCILCLNVQAVICSLAFVTFTVGLETPQSRLQLTFILLLTTVTFKFVVNKSLPRISYLTYMVRHSFVIVNVIVKSRFLQRPQKRSPGNPLIHR